MECNSGYNLIHKEAITNGKVNVLYLKNRAMKFRMRASLYCQRKYMDNSSLRANTAKFKTVEVLSLVLDNYLHDSDLQPRFFWTAKLPYIDFCPNHCCCN